MIEILTLMDDRTAHRTKDRIVKIVGKPGNPLDSSSSDFDSSTVLVGSSG